MNRKIFQNSQSSKKIIFKIFRGNSEGGEFKEYSLPLQEGMVVLDAVLEIQDKYQNDLGFRCNCKAGKCGSCSAEINGFPRLMCKTRLNTLNLKKPIVISPLKTFPIIKDLVTDVEENFQINKKIIPLAIDESRKIKMYQYEVERVQEFRKCIECFLCQNICHIWRVHNKKDKYFGPRFFVRLANLVFHPLDKYKEERAKQIKEEAGLGFCNITKCCTEVCPEKIKITDNAIIPLKEKIADLYYDPFFKLFNKLFKQKK